MPSIASFHLVREHPRRQALVLARLGIDRLRLRRVAGLRFFRLLGTGRGDDTAPSSDLLRSAVFAVWDDETDLERFLAEHPIARRWQGAAESWHVRLRGAGGHGAWRGFDVLAAIEPGLDPANEPAEPATGGRGGGSDAGDAHRLDRDSTARRPVADGPIAVITRADIRLRSWRRFATAGRPVSDEVREADGLLAVVGIGEAPIGRLGTFSVWESAAAARRFAHRMPEHVAVVERTRREGWYGEELFARFVPFGSSGTWGGRDPLGSSGAGRTPGPRAM